MRTNWAVYDAVTLDVGGAAGRAVTQAVYWALSMAVSQAVYDDLSHPTLPAFLGAAADQDPP